MKRRADVSSFSNRNNALDGEAVVSISDGKRFKSKQQAWTFCKTFSVSVGKSDRVKWTNTDSSFDSDCCCSKFWPQWPNLVKFWLFKGSNRWGRTKVSRGKNACLAYRGRSAFEWLRHQTPSLECYVPRKLLVQLFSLPTEAFERNHRAREPPEEGARRRKLRRKKGREEETNLSVNEAMRCVSYAAPQSTTYVMRSHLSSLHDGPQCVLASLLLAIRVVSFLRRTPTYVFFLSFTIASLSSRVYKSNQCAKRS